MVEIEFPKPRGRDAKENESVDIEDFISVKGIKALGNQFITEKVKNINLLEPLPFEPVAPEQPENIEVVDEESLTSNDENEKSKDGKDPSADEPTLFD